jgi:hypothetical protein
LEAAVTDGLILLGLLAVLFAIFAGRARRRLGMPMSFRILSTIIAGFAIVVLVMWVASTH